MGLAALDGRSIREIIRFVIVGGWNTVLGYGLFAGSNYLLADRIPHAYMVACVIANVIAISVAYVGHKFVTFRTRGNYLREYLRFYIVYGATALLGLALLPLTVALIGLVVATKSHVPYIAQAVLIPINVVASYLGHKRFSFRPPTKRVDDPGREP
jgi:putative flippase GtrA